MQKKAAAGTDRGASFQNAGIDAIRGSLVDASRGIKPESAEKLDELLGCDNVAAKLEEVYVGSRLPLPKFSAMLAPAVAGTESPIELLFALSYFEEVAMEGPAYRDAIGRAEAHYSSWGYYVAAGAEGLRPQAVLHCGEKGYRADFALEVGLCIAEPGGPGVQILSDALIECDGRQFHGTWEKHIDDEARTRDLLLAGYPAPIRFDGGSICRDARGCVLEALEISLRRIANREYVAALIAKKRLAMFEKRRVYGMQAAVCPFLGARHPVRLPNGRRDYVRNPDRSI